MFCKNCGAQIPDQSAFCENCGAAIQSDANTEQPAVQPYSNPNTYGVQSYPDQNTYAAQPYQSPNAYGGQAYPGPNMYGAQPYQGQNVYGGQGYPNQNMYAAQSFPNAYPEEPGIRAKFSWVPITLAVVALIISAELGGDPDFNEVNLFDWLGAIISVGSFVSTFFLIPQRRKVLRTIAIIITGFMALATVLYLFP